MRSFTSPIVLVQSVLAILAALYGISYWKGSDSDGQRRVQHRAARKRFIFPKLRCALALRRNGFDIADFANYPKFFRNDSVIQLAQAGVYQTPSSIEEYVKFAYNAFSPYRSNTAVQIPDEKKQILGYNRQTGQCEFLSLYKTLAAMNLTTTNPDVPPFSYITMVKLFLDVEQNYIPRINVYYAPDFLRVYFGVVLNSNNTRRFLCDDVFKGPCAATLNTTSSDTCMKTLASLPAAEGELQHVVGNTLGCRALHGAFARTNAEMHCPHVSFPPMADPMGRIKCQSSVQKLAPSDLVTESDVAKFREFATGRGIDPEKGHDSSM